MKALLLLALVGCGPSPTTFSTSDASLSSDAGVCAGLPQCVGSAVNPVVGAPCCDNGAVKTSDGIGGFR